MSDAIFHMIPDATWPVAPHSHLVEKPGWPFVTGTFATNPADDSLPLPDGIEAPAHKVMNTVIDTRPARGVQRRCGQIGR